MEMNYWSEVCVGWSTAFVLMVVGWRPGKGAGGAASRLVLGVSHAAAAAGEQASLMAELADQVEGRVGNLRPATT